MVAPAPPLQRPFAPGGYANGTEACREFPRERGHDLIAPPTPAPARGSRYDDERRPSLPRPPEPRPQLPRKAVQRTLQIGAVPGLSRHHDTRRMVVVSRGGPPRDPRRQLIGSGLGSAIEASMTRV